MTSKARSMMAWTSSGSRRSDMAVKPDTSVNMTVTCLRSPSIALLDVRIFSARCLGVYDCGVANRPVEGGAGAAGGGAIAGAGLAARSAGGGEAVSLAPQSPQNLLVTGLEALQAGQESARR